ncbi:hypothetical protein [Pseudanabaena sp. FACHB-2040]|uniref:hypothetical protein n=1 Tax=Pseudanabaena sp. FACHB-2040 TaxID=2692859 RepID=UPI0016875CF7|nr:hypothetical protein [Pseudanabaena sp. FACHB-2040]MBD2260561.1 hypothetical protein [Pseudanabaena sp. FACHB-2040]
MNIQISSNKLVRNLILLGVALSLISLFIQGVQYFSSFSIHPKIVFYLNVDAENNVPTLYSSALLFLSSVLLYTIAVAARGARKKLYWQGLALVFLFLSVDELLQLHENINGLLNSTTQAGDSISGSGRWDVFSLMLFAVVSLSYFRFFLALPQRVKRLFFVAAVSFVVGGAGIEFIGVNFFPDIYHQPIFLAEVISTVEEFLEILGTCLFISGLLAYTQYELKAIRLEFASVPKNGVLQEAEKASV